MQLDIDWDWKRWEFMYSKGWYDGPYLTIRIGFLEIGYHDIK